MEELTRQQRKDIQLRLAAQLQHYLTVETDSRLSWMGTKTNLIEVVNYLYMAGTMTDDYGIPLAMKELTRRACERFNLPVPKSLSRFLENINKVQGLRSHTMLEMMSTKLKKYGRMPELRAYMK